MKSTGKTKKQRMTDSTKARPCCGTLDYIAECRGAAAVVRKTASPGRQGHVDVFGRIGRKL